MYNRLKIYACRYQKIWLFSFVTMLAAFGYMLTTPALTIDEETWILQEGYNNLWLLQGRPGIYLLNLIYTEYGRFVPFFAEALSLLLWSIAGFLLAGILFYDYLKEEKDGSRFALFTFCAYFNTLPFVVGESMAFSMMTVQEYIGLLFVIPAILLTIHHAESEIKKKSLVLAALSALTFAVSCYQALIGIYVTAIIALCLLFYEKKKSCKKLIIYSVALCIATVGVQFVLNRAIGMVIGTGGYLTDNYIGWGDGIGYALFMALANVIRVLFAIPIQGEYIYGGGVIRVITIAFIIDTVFRMVKEKGAKRKLGTFFFSAALAASPFFLYIAMGTYKTHGRVLLALALSGAVELVLILRDIRPGFWKKAAKVAVILVILANISNMNRIYYYESLVYEYDVKTADTVMYDIEREGLDYHSKPVAFVGMREMDVLPIQKSGTLGGSFFSWDDGNEKRMIDFIKTRGYVLIQPTGEQMAAAAEYSGQMNCWPMDGSILETDQMIIVKFSEPTEKWYITNNVVN